MSVTARFPGSSSNAEKNYWNAGGLHRAPLGAGGLGYLAPDLIGGLGAGVLGAGTLYAARVQGLASRLLNASPLVLQFGSAALSQVPNFSGMFGSFAPFPSQR